MLAEQASGEPRPQQPDPTPTRPGEIRRGGGAIPVAPSMADALEQAGVGPGLDGDAAHTPPAPAPAGFGGWGTIRITCIASIIAVCAALIAQLLAHLIWGITALSFHGELSVEHSSPMGHRLGLWVIIVPVIGGLIVGFMARYGARAIRGHGIPEAMEQVILNESRIPARMAFLKPLSAAIAIGTGGPFGAEGPIIATGGAFGSLVGQFLRTTAHERKTLLAAGAAAGMSATFGAPVSAVLLAVELLLFEFRARSIVPVAVAASIAAGVRMMFEGSGAVFAMPDLTAPGAGALAVYGAIGAVMGIASVAVTRAVYAIEDGFEKLPIHWMWWPAIGGVVVGVVGCFHPRTLGVGYFNITDILGANLALGAVASLALWKFISWSIALGSGTSGGTLAPMFTIGGALGALLGAGSAGLLPGLGIDPRIGALVGMAAIFAGASRALLASAVFAFETTMQPAGLLPLLLGCSLSYMVSSLLMRSTIMTEKIERRGVRVPSEYEADFLSQVLVRDVGVRGVVTLAGTMTVAEARAWVSSRAEGSSHQGFPVLDERGVLHSVVTRRALFDAGAADDATLMELAVRPPVVVYSDNTLRDAADHMVRHGIGRLPVIDRGTGALVGIITRSDLLGAHARRIADASAAERHLNFGKRRVEG